RRRRVLQTWLPLQELRCAAGGQGAEKPGLRQCCNRGCGGRSRAGDRAGARGKVGVGDRAQQRSAALDGLGWPDGGAASLVRCFRPPIWAPWSAIGSRRIGKGSSQTSTHTTGKPYPSLDRKPKRRRPP